MKIVLPILISIFLIFLSGCTDNDDKCALIECLGNEGRIELLVTHDGEFVFYDADSVILATVRLFIADPVPREISAGMGSPHTLELWLGHGTEYHLEIKGYGAGSAIGTVRDTIIGTTQLISVGECCSTYEIIEVTRNGIPICFGDCDETILFEI